MPWATRRMSKVDDRSWLRECFHVDCPIGRCLAPMLLEDVIRWYLQVLVKHETKPYIR